MVPSMSTRSLLSVGAVAGAAVLASIGVAVSPVSAATTIDAIVPIEVDALNRTVLDVSANGLWALTTENGDGRPEKRINLATGAVDALPPGMGNPHLTADGSLIVFTTFDALVAADTNSDIDIYTYDIGADTNTLVPLVNAPAGWTFQLQDISGNARYLGMYGTNGVIADSGSFIFDRTLATWAQPDSLLPDFAEGPQRQSNQVRISNDGRFAAWVTASAAGAFSEVWVYNIAANTAVRASQRFDNAALNDGWTSDPEISPDGRHVVFRSTASNLVIGVGTPGSRVYVRHLDSAQTVLVTAAETETAPYSGPSIGGPGTQVFVMEAVPSTVNASPQSAPQPVVYDLAAGTRMVLTEPVGAAVPNGYTLYGAISANGARAVYAGTVDNAGAVTPTDPVGQSSMRVLQTSFKAPLPARLLDTRPNGSTDDGEFQGGGVRAAGSTLTLDVAGRQTIPAEAEAAVLNITAVAPAGGGWVTAYPCDAVPPNASSLNVSAGRTIANMAISRLAADGTVCLFTSVGMHLLVDALSYFPSGSDLESLVPQRMLDTRPIGSTIDDLFEQAGPVAANGTVTLDLAGRGDITADAVAVVVNITATGHVTNGFLRAYPCDAAPPNASVANFQAGLTKASQTVVSLSATGQVCLNTSAQTNLIVDAVGYFDASSAYVTLTPARLLETRIGAVFETVDGQFEGGDIRPAGSTVELQVSGRGNVPAGNQTVVLNVTAISSPGTGFVTAYPCGQARPDVSVLNMVPGATVNNHLVVDTGTGGKVCVYVSSGTHMLVDVEGVLP